MLIGRVIRHEVEDQLQAPAMHLGEQPVEVSSVPKTGSMPQ